MNCALYLRFALLGLATIILLPGLQSQNTPSLDSLLHAAEILSAEETMELYEEHFLLLANGDLEEGKKLAHKALEIAQESGNGDLEFMARGYMAHAYYLSGDYETAGAQDEWRIEHCLNHGEPGCLGNMLNFVANFLSRFGEYEKGMRYLEDALPDCRAAGDSICVGTNFDHRGNINMRMGKIDEAEKAYQRCLEIRLHVGDTIGLGYVYNNLAWVAAERGDTEDGLRYLSKSLEIREMIGEGYGIATSLANIGETHFMAGNMQEAVSYWKRAMVKAEEIGVMDMKIYILEHIADAYANLGQSQKAIESLKIAHHLKDSILTNEAARASAALEVRYETERQENLISIQQLTIDRQNQRNQSQMIIALAVFLLFSLGALYFYQRNHAEQQAAMQAARLEHQEELLSNTIEVQEEERRRIARDLHDGIGQQLTGLKLAWQKIASEDGESDELKRVSGILRDTARDVRDLSHQMMPRSLSELGLVPAMEDLVEQAFRDSGIEGSFEHFGKTDRFDQSKETALYRIAQELIGNIGKHSQATQASIQLLRNKDGVVLVAEDNGKGFDHSKSNGRSHGLANIDSRSRAAGGQVRFESAEGAGTVVTVRIPLTENSTENG